MRSSVKPRDFCEFKPKPINTFIADLQKNTKRWKKNKTTIEILNTRQNISEKSVSNENKTKIIRQKEKKIGCTLRASGAVLNKRDLIQITSKSTLYNDRFWSLVLFYSPFDNAFMDFFPPVFRFHILSS